MLNIPIANDRPLQFLMEGVIDVSSTGKLWTELEKDADPSFFISWHWIESWLQIMEPNARLCKVYSSQRLVALGFFVSAKQRRHKVIGIRQVRLQSTGDEDKDQVWPEYNNMLVAKGYETAVYKGLMFFLAEQGGGWDEFVVGPVDDSLLGLISNNDYQIVDLWNEPSFGVDLMNLRSKGEAYLDSLSKNTRYQIRKAIRQFGEGLDLQLASSKEEAQQYLLCIEKLHKQRWLLDSGFYNDTFITFHKALINKCFDDGVIEMVKLQVHGEGVGYLYNFIFNNRVYFYLSGIDLVTEGKRKPGLVLHALCIQRHLELGTDSYDFLGGYARYKENLGKKTGQLTVAAFQKPLLKLRVEQMARRVKHYIENNVSSNEAC